MRIKVVHFISSLGRGGRERQLAIICSHAQNIDNRVICFNRREAEYWDEELVDSLQMPDLKLPNIELDSPYKKARMTKKA